MEVVPLSLHFQNCAEGYTEKWECHFSIMEDTNKELCIARVGYNTRIHYIYKSGLAEPPLVLTFSSPKNSAIDSIQKVFFVAF